MLPYISLAYIQLTTDRFETDLCLSKKIVRFEMSKKAVDMNFEERITNL